MKSFPTDQIAQHIRIAVAMKKEGWLTGYVYFNLKHYASAIYIRRFFFSQMGKVRFMHNYTEPSY